MKMKRGIDKNSITENTNRVLTLFDNSKSTAGQEK